MKIAHIISPNYMNIDQAGGTARFVYDLAAKQVAENNDVTLVGYHNQLKKLNTISFVTPMKKGRNWLLNWLIERKVEGSHVYKSFKWIGSGFDIIHNHLSEAGIGLSFLGKSPCLTTLHGLARTQIIYYSIEKLFALPKKTKLVAISRSSYFKHKQFYGDDLIGYVYHGIDVKRIPFIQKPKKSHNIELCFAGRIAPDKGPHLAVEVADKLHELGFDVHLTLMGLFEPRYPKYFIRIHEMVAKRSHITAKFNVSNLTLFSYMGNSDAMLLPILREEPFGLVQLEAMSCGTPVIAFPGGAATEIIHDEVNGFLCNDAGSMTKAVVKIAEIDRKKCREIVEKSFSADVMYKAYLKMYKHVIQAC